MGDEHLKIYFEHISNIYLCPKIFSDIEIHRNKYIGCGILNSKCFDKAFQLIIKMSRYSTHFFPMPRWKTRLDRTF